MMEIVMFDIVPFKSFVNLIMDSTNTIELIFNQYGLKITLLNDSHVCFYEAEFKKEFFDYYQVDDVESVMLDSSDLFKVLKSTKAADELHMESDDSHIILKIESKNGNRRIFELPLVDREYSSPAPPNIDYPLDFSVDLSKLSDCVSDLDKIVGTDRLKLVVDDGLSISATNDVMTGYKCELDDSITGNGHVVVNTAYIGGLKKLSGVNKVVEFKIGNNIPLSWSISSQMDDVIFNGMIAPILEEE